MMKITALISAAIMAIVLLSGCENQSVNNNRDKSVLSIVSNTTPEDKLHLALYLNPCLGGCYNYGNSMPTGLENFLSAFGSSELESDPRVFNAGFSDEYQEKYYVLRSNNVKIGDYFVYVFYRNKVSKNYWYRCGRAVRVAKRLTAKDFENITIGSTIADVTAVDPITPVMIPQDFLVSDGTPITYLEFETFHYTVDGLYYIKFERESPKDEYLITQIEFDPSFEVPIRDFGRFKDVGYANGFDLDNPEPPVHQEIELKHLPD